MKSIINAVFNLKNKLSECILNTYSAHLLKPVLLRIPVR